MPTEGATWFYKSEKKTEAGEQFCFDVSESGRCVETEERLLTGSAVRRRSGVGSDCSSKSMQSSEDFSLAQTNRRSRGRCYGCVCGGRWCVLSR